MKLTCYRYYHIAISGPIRQAAGSALDCILVSQAYHSLHSRAEELRAARAALDDEEGTLGLIWHRPAEESGAWLRAFSAAAERAEGRRTDLLPPLQPDQTPIAWVEGLDAAAHRFRPFR